jgi:hypothetical protein
LPCTMFPTIFLPWKTASHQYATENHLALGCSKGSHLAFTKIIPNFQKELKNLALLCHHHFSSC